MFMNERKYNSALSGCLWELSLDWAIHWRGVLQGFEDDSDGSGDEGVPPALHDAQKSKQKGSKQSDSSDSSGSSSEESADDDKKKPGGLTGSSAATPNDIDWSHWIWSKLIVCFDWTQIQTKTDVWSNKNTTEPKCLIEHEYKKNRCLIE